MPVMAMLAISRVEAPALASITICASDVTPPLLATLFVTKFGWDKLFDLFVFFTLISGQSVQLAHVSPRLTPDGLTVQCLSLPSSLCNLYQ